MSKYFLNGTTLEQSEILMMIPTGFSPKHRTLFDHLGTARCDCCLHKPQGKETCGGSCFYLSERIRSKSIRYFELARQTALKLQSSLLLCKIGVRKEQIEPTNRYVSRLHRCQWNQLMGRREYIRTTNKMAAALFLLTATETLWERMQELVSHKHIQFSEVCLRGMNSTDYTLFQFAKTLYQKGKLDMEEVTDSEIVDADLFPTVLHSVVLRMHGLAAHHIQ